MDQADKIAMVRVLANVTTDEYSDEQITKFLALAEARILQKMYPFTMPEGATVPTRYHMVECELAVRKMMKQGAEGEKAHAENGVNRTYNSADEKDLLDEVISYCEVG